MFRKLKIPQGITKSLLVVSAILNIAAVILIYQYGSHRQVPQSTLASSFDSVKSSTDEKFIKGNTIDILALPYDNPVTVFPSGYLSEDKNKRTIYIDGNTAQQVVYRNHDISFAIISPSHQKIGFFFYPEDHSLREIVLAILDIGTKTVSEIYRGDTWTSNWEWRGDSAVITKRSCGNWCMNAFVIDISTGEKIDEYKVY